MWPEKFNHLVDLLREKISKENRRRLSTSPEERLAITLRYFVTGNSQTDLAFKIGQSTIYHIIIEVCEEIWDVLSEYVRPPSTTEDSIKNTRGVFRILGYTTLYRSVGWKIHQENKNRQILVPCGIIIKVFSAWYCWMCMMRVTVLPWLMLESMAVKMTVES